MEASAGSCLGEITHTCSYYPDTPLSVEEELGKA